MQPPTALLAEDDPAVRAMLVRALDQFGYVVLAAADGPEALALAAGHVGPIRLVITDIHLPGLTGGELARALGATRPEAAVLFISGRPAPRDLSNTVVGRAAAFLAKPFTLDSLRAALTELVSPLPSPQGRDDAEASDRPSSG